MIPISEIFLSIQWEWRNTWKPSIFVRFWWCNKKCSFCDTPYAVIDRTEMKPYDFLTVIEKIKSFPCKHIVFTWWEPALFEKQISDIMMELNKTDIYTIEIETNGSLPLFLRYNQVNVSPKLSNSWVEEYELMVKSEYDDIDYKFVVYDNDDLREVEQYIEKYNLPKENIRLMPLWITKESQINLLVANYCIEHWYRYCQRTHILLFWNKRWV